MSLELRGVSKIVGGQVHIRPTTLVLAKGTMNVLLGPTLSVLGVFFFYPLGVAVYDSLHEWDLLTPPRYVGFENYRTLFQSGAFAEVLATTLIVSVMPIPCNGTCTIS